MGKITDYCADEIAASEQKIVIPHPTKKNCLIVGWVVPEQNIKLGVATLALQEISKWWKISRAFANR